MLFGLSAGLPGLSKATILKRSALYLPFTGNKTRVRVENALSEKFESLLSPLLSNVYSKRLIRQFLENTKEGILLKGVLII